MTQVINSNAVALFCFGPRHSIFYSPTIFLARKIEHFLRFVFTIIVREHLDIHINIYFYIFQYETLLFQKNWDNCARRRR